mmetsp:Transcript_18501/g.15417  ORF Transcript_18501/g.15417 Transcript_18501/m.15417 type:complete len:81 (+) Transcript_18501:92-334(+)
MKTNTVKPYAEKTITQVMKPWDDINSRTVRRHLQRKHSDLHSVELYEEIAYKCQSWCPYEDHRKVAVEPYAVDSPKIDRG